MYARWRGRVLDDFLDVLDGIACAIDADNRIVAVGRCRWDRFAVENDVPDLSADRTAGRNLFDIAIGPEMRRACRRLAGAADGARQLCLSLAPLRFPDGRPGLLLRVRIVGETAAPRLDISDLAMLAGGFGRDADLPVIAVCSFCRRVRRPGSSDEEDWIAAEEYDRLAGSVPVRISHGLCADCDAVRFPEV
jgi:hypothetical protein